MTYLDVDSGTVYMDECDFLAQCVLLLAIVRKLEAIQRDLKDWEERSSNDKLLFMP